MPTYLYQAAYTPESLAAQIKDPKDRIEVVRPVFEAAGGKILASGYPFGEYDVIAVYEARMTRPRPRWPWPSPRAGRCERPRRPAC